MICIVRKYCCIVRRLFSEPLSTPYIIACFLLIDAFFCLVILSKVSYTEIDWETYMTQVSLYLSGERNYTRIKGSTGPIVYPAGFLYLYSLLYKLTDSGQNILKGQQIFMFVYLVTLFFVSKIYYLAPFYTYIFLIFSKRLHSIYLLRLFNDCWVTLFSYVAIYAYAMHSWILGTCFFGIALGIKMNVLLFFPAIAMILLQMLDRKHMLWHFFVIFVIQEYISRAFDFSRVFLYRWTVNWKFLSESVFLSKKISGYSLKKICFSLLNTKPQLFNKTRKTSIQIRSLIVITLFTSNLIGVLCARSLHYQFYCWFAWSMPYILAKTRIPIMFQFAIWALQEYAWNIYPSTPYSSFIITTIHMLVLFLLLIRY
ncbi:hypothetical protein PMAC_002323 [Pneumocystis sp. 'macacae']|nr:hypothetical protein PMAC_002323 [Pneumocystis sp. 'macacae']